MRTWFMRRSHRQLPRIAETLDTLWQGAAALAKIGTMLVPLMSHPDRCATTLANLPECRAARPGSEFNLPAAGAADCRIDLKLLQWRALAAAARSPRAREHLAALAPAEHPDLWAGTVQDGVARGFAARLEEAIALAPPLPPLEPLANARVTEGKELRKRKDVLVASGGSRVRFTRKEGLLFVDREAGLHASNCLRFEARADHGTLDGFVGAVDERARLFSAQFLQSRRYVEADNGSELTLVGRIGRGPIGWNCQLQLTARLDWPAVRLTLRLDQRVTGWRLRARFLGLPLTAITYECMPMHEVVDNDAGGFVACTLVRACPTLLVDGAPIEAPGACSHGQLLHTFHLGVGDDAAGLDTSAAHS
jgi:hypothetical protein